VIPFYCVLKLVEIVVGQAGEQGVLRKMLIFTLK